MEDDPDDIVLAEIAIRLAAIPFRLRHFPNIAAATAYLKGEGGFADRAVHPLPSAVLLDYHLAQDSYHEYLQYACPLDLTPKDRVACSTHPQYFTWPSDRFFIHHRPQ